MIAPPPRWQSTAIAAILVIPLLVLVVLSAPVWIAWPFLDRDRRTTVLGFLSRLVEWARVLARTEN